MRTVSTEFIISPMFLCWLLYYNAYYDILKIKYKFEYLNYSLIFFKIETWF